MILSADLPALIAEHRGTSDHSFASQPAVAAPSHRMRSLALAMTSVVTNITQVGVCSNAACPNGPLRESEQDESCFCLQRTSALGSVVDSLEDEGTFPLAVVASRIVSPVGCIKRPLADFVLGLLVACRSGSRGLVCSPETVVMALILLQRTQHANIVKHQLHVADQLNRHRSAVAPSPSSGSAISWWLAQSNHVPAAPSSLCVDGSAHLLPAEASGRSYLSVPSTVTSPSTRTDSSSLGPDSLCAAEVHVPAACPDCVLSQVFSINHSNVHVFVAACFLLAIKLNEDTRSNSSCGLLRLVSNILLDGDAQSLYWAERCVLDVLQFQLFIPPADYTAMVRSLSIAAQHDAETFLPLFASP